jgi:hypothetical protein
MPELRGHASLISIYFAAFRPSAVFQFLPAGTSISASPDHGPEPASKERVHPVEHNNTDDAEQQYGKGE